VVAWAAGATRATLQSSAAAAASRELKLISNIPLRVELWVAQRPRAETRALNDEALARPAERRRMAPE
jgi:hypothetical protein